MIPSKKLLTPLLVLATLVLSACDSGILPAATTPVAEVPTATTALAPDATPTAAPPTTPAAGAKYTCAWRRPRPRHSIRRRGSPPLTRCAERR